MTITGRGTLRRQNEGGASFCRSLGLAPEGDGSPAHLTEPPKPPAVEGKQGRFSGAKLKAATHRQRDANGDAVQFDGVGQWGGSQRLFVAMGRTCFDQDAVPSADQPGAFAPAGHSVSSETDGRLALGGSGQPLRR